MKEKIAKGEELQQLALVVSDLDREHKWSLAIEEEKKFQELEEDYKAKCLALDKIRVLQEAQHSKKKEIENNLK